MKISFECDCVLLQNSLLSFCKDFIAHRKDCDFIVADKKIESKKPVFVIAEHSPHLKIPFSKEALISALEEFYSATQISKAKEPDQIVNEKSLEQKVSNLIDKFKADLLEILRANQ